MKKFHWKLHFYTINQIKIYIFITSLLLTIFFTTQCWLRRDNFRTIDLWGLLLIWKMTSVKFSFEWCVNNWYLGDLLFLVTLWRHTFRPLTKKSIVPKLHVQKFATFRICFFVSQGMTFCKKTFCSNFADPFSLSLLDYS